MSQCDEVTASEIRRTALVLHDSGRSRDQFDPPLEAGEEAAGDRWTVAATPSMSPGRGVSTTAQVAGPFTIHHPEDPEDIPSVTVASPHS